MERINLTKERTVNIPVTINDKDYDLPFNAEDMQVRAIVIEMASDIAEYSNRGAKLAELANAKDPDTITNTLADFKAFANEGVELCKSLSQRMAMAVDNWAEIVGGNFINLKTFEALIGCMQTLITAKEVESKVNAQLEDER